MKKQNKPLSRRKILAGTGSLIAATPFLATAASQAIIGQVTRRPRGPRPGPIDPGDDVVSTGDWVSGDTSLITVDYPDTRLFESSGSCSFSLTDGTTEGPCYFGVTEKEDISEGRTGLPMMLCMQLIDEDCNPLEGYLIEVWHCDSEGVYSADTTDSDDTSTWGGSGFCADNNEEAEASKWFRGELVTDNEGRVNFKSCFPGWYGGRTIHIHFRVRQPSGGSDYVISQFCFTDEFAKEICTTHEVYSTRGEQDTTLASGTDTVFPSSGYDDFTLNVVANTDGTLLAFKRIQITA